MSIIPSIVVNTIGITSRSGLLNFIFSYSLGKLNALNLSSYLHFTYIDTHVVIALRTMFL